MQQPLDLTQIMAILRRLLPTLARQYHVQSLAVFGSYVRHAQRPGSDLDVLVTFKEPPGLLRFLALENFLTDVLGIKVDLVMREALKPAIGEHVLQELVPV
ncbi:MAG: nucleotidyltransferase family protein [Candidatus Entotheonellia bacterium]